MKTSRLFVASLLLLVFCVGVQAQDIDLEKHPGYVNLEEIKIPEKSGKITDISLGPALLKIAQWARDDEDENLKKGLSGIFSIRVKSFEIGYDEAKKIRPIMDKIEEKLIREKWERLVRVKEEDELTNISIKFDDKGKAVGFLLMSLDPGNEVSFVNIIGGDISLKNIRNIGMGLSDSALDSLKMDLDWD